MTADTFPQHYNGLITGFVEDMRNRVGEGLQSITIYGSMARGDFVDGVSDVNVLIVAKSLPPETLKSAGEVVRHWQQQLPLSPIFATPEYLTRSSDVFPLEFLDMRDAHVTVFGRDPLENLQIDLRMLRHQVEAELKGKLMRLRSAYAGIAGNEAAVRHLLRDSLASFRILFQGALRLCGQVPPRRTTEVMRAIARAYDLDEATLEQVARIHERPQHADVSAEDLVGPYLAAIERLVAIVDAWDGPETATATVPA